MALEYKKIAPEYEGICEQFLINLIVAGYEIWAPDRTVINRWNLEKLMAEWKAGGEMRGESQGKAGGETREEKIARLAKIANEIYRPGPQKGKM